ncbi:hypothetical protein ARAM_001342 [Aspergillus rambellii]|uniref:Uncharacterized protein n=1 Tax=Aspergillus rambellii TaxID=308745 RepID=A0A0F8UDZ2_9EURO|nr:hypothetical protein ARAM_001342 [Aspergillus rambellii]
MTQSNQAVVNPRVPIWRSILQNDTKSWVLFEHGTCVILMEPESDLAAQASEILSTWGPVCAGTPAGDFNVIDLAEPCTGWVVTGHHPDVLNYVSPQDVTESSTLSDMQIGLLGRGYRDEDANSLNVVHVEDNRVKN